jgi:hypothetical protein
MTPRSVLLPLATLLPSLWAGACGGQSTLDERGPETGGKSSGTAGRVSAGGGENIGGSLSSGGRVATTGGRGTTGGVGAGTAASGDQSSMGFGGTRVAAGGQRTGGAGTVIASGGQHKGGAAGAALATGGQLVGGTGGVVIALGGRAAAAGATIAAGGGEPSGGAGGAPGCAVLSQTRSSRAARSAGFSGAYDVDYYPLYSVSCTTLAECQTACVQAGGSEQSCASSECIHSVTDYCLPPTYWFDLDLLRVEGGRIESSAWIILVNHPYRDQLLASDFQFELPPEATLQGIAVSINRSADMAELIADYEVKLLRSGSTVGLDRAKTAAWAAVFQYVTYGGPSDLWGVTWTPADLNSTGFGVALTPMYLSTAGNARGYVDFIRATAYYFLPCN